MDIVFDLEAKAEQWIEQKKMMGTKSDFELDQGNSSKGFEVDHITSLKRRTSIKSDFKLDQGKSLKEYRMLRIRKGDDFEVDLEGTLLKWHTDRNSTINVCESKKNMKNNDRYLYVQIGIDTILSLNITELTESIKNKSPNSEPKLEELFCHKGEVPKYPVGMGLFLMDSKLYFFGGENLQKRSHLLVKKNKIDSWPFTDIPETILPDLIPKFGEDWFNKRILSCNLSSLSPLNPSPLDLSPLPNHYGYKARPIVFVISDKVYVFTTQPFTEALTISNEKIITFECFDPNKGKNGEWKILSNPPDKLCEYVVMTMDRMYERHFVYKDKFVLDTGDYHFTYDTKSNSWSDVERFPTIYAALEYGDGFLLALSGTKFVSYDLETFRDPVMKCKILDKRNIYVNSSGALIESFENNRVCIVTCSISKIDVYVYSIIIKGKYPSIFAVLEFHKKYPHNPLPRRNVFAYDMYSSFLWCATDDTAKKPRVGSTKAVIAYDYNYQSKYKEEDYLTGVEKSVKLGDSDNFVDLNYDREFSDEDIES